VTIASNKTNGISAPTTVQTWSW